MCLYDKNLGKCGRICNSCLGVCVCGALVGSKHKHNNNLPLKFKVLLKYV